MEIDTVTVFKKYNGNKISTSFTIREKIGYQ